MKAKRNSEVSFEILKIGFRKIGKIIFSEEKRFYCKFFDSHHVFFS